MTPRYTIRIRLWELRTVCYAVFEIWRVSDTTKIHEEWQRPLGAGPDEAVRIMRLLEVAPDELAEAIIEGVKMKRKRARVAKLPWRWDEEE
jgi:hypothetical protein